MYSLTVTGNLSVTALQWKYEYRIEFRTSVSAKQNKI